VIEVLKQLETRIDTMNLRERALLLCAGIATVFFLIDTFCLQPAFKAHKQNREAISAWETELDVLQTRSGLLYGEAEQDQLLLREQLQGKLAGLASRLQDQLGILLAPDQATEVLEQVLVQEKGLKLREVDAVSRPLTGTELLADTAALTTGIGRYDLRLQLEGSYLATLRYLHALESLPWKFFWEDVDFEITEYPNAQVTLDIYTLGLLEW
jgi:MSHA biogenesis protein MshJ